MKGCKLLTLNVGADNSTQSCVRAASGGSDCAVTMYWPCDCDSTHTRETIGAHAAWIVHDRSNEGDIFSLHAESVKATCRIDQVSHRRPVQSIRYVEYLFTRQVACCRIR